MNFTKFTILLVLSSAFMASCTQLFRLNDDEEKGREIDAMQSTINALESRLEEAETPPLLPEESAEMSTEPVLTLEPIIEPTPEHLPTEPVAAGIPVVYDGWALTLSPDIGASDRHSFSSSGFKLQFAIRNLGENERLFRYTKSGISVSDNLGNEYEFIMTSSDCRSEPDTIHITNQLSIGGGESINIYCAHGTSQYPCVGKYTLPPFKGVIPIEADQLRIRINSWGPFDGVDFYIDL